MVDVAKPQDKFFLAMFEIADKFDTQFRKAFTMKEEYERDAEQAAGGRRRKKWYRHDV